MKCTSFARFIFTALVLAGPASADWVGGDAKWLQRPDLEPTGIDVHASANLGPFMVLADDFECTNTCAITNITIWGSWLDDVYPDGDPGFLAFTLSLHRDIPAGVQEEWSMPGEPVWLQHFGPGQFTIDLEAGGIQEGWMFPPDQYVFPGDSNCFRYTFPVSIGDAFIQRGTADEPVVYWLDVQAEPWGEGEFGWKTSLDHWNDDAVWVEGFEPELVFWQELRYPFEHPFAGESIDLAFMIECGGDLYDFGDAPDPTYPTLQASTGAYHRIGGPWFGDASNYPDADLDGQPDPDALGDDNDGNDDELGVWFLDGPLERGVTYTNLQAVVGGAGGNVEFWVDLNGDGTWQHPGEQLFSQFLAPGTYLFHWPVPVSVPVGPTFSRWRISTQGGLAPAGGALDGEVEDHKLYFTNAWVNWGQIQFPASAGVPAGTTVDVYGRVYHPGITEPAGQGAGITAELGYGPDGTHPTGAGWTWIAAAYNTDLGNDDEYMATIPALPVGRYDYAYRFSRNGVDWLYVDNPPGANNASEYNISEAGDLEVIEPGLDGCPKWLQEPDCDYGVDMPTYAISLDQGIDPDPIWVVADDWMCDGRPITAVRWWGSYPGWELPEPPLTQSQGRPQGFRLRWWTDLPVDAPGNERGYSMPLGLITNVFVPLGDYQQSEMVPGVVAESYYCTVSNKATLPPFEHEYEYAVELPEPWNEKADNIYWLSIEAVYDGQVYDPGPGGPEWGWKTSWETNLFDDAVIWAGQYDPVPTWYEMFWPEYPWPFLFVPATETEFNYQVFISPPFEGRPSVGMAFELLTDICPRRTAKWSRMPDMVEGTDMWSWFVAGEQQPASRFLRADDFISDGRPISDIHWWGSYSNWWWWVEGSETNPVPPPGTGPGHLRPLGFRLSWHEHSEQPPCGLPGNLITNIFVPIDECHESFYGTVHQAWVVPASTGAGPQRVDEYFEHEYQYYVDLLDVDAPWPEREGGHYWLNIEAEFEAGFNPTAEQFMHGGWGWKIAEIQTDPTCPPAVFDRASGGWLPDPTGLPPGHPRKADMLEYEYDLAFELTTHIPDTNAPSPIVITNVIASAGATTHRVLSVGTTHAGVQYLRKSTNLTTNVWVDVMSKAAPHPFPLTNTWIRAGAAESNVFYRVEER